MESEEANRLKMRLDGTTNGTADEVASGAVYGITIGTIDEVAGGAVYGITIGTVDEVAGGAVYGTMKNNAIKSRFMFFSS